MALAHQRPATEAPAPGSPRDAARPRVDAPAGPTRADALGRIASKVSGRRDVARLFDAGDFVVANDAATIPASLTGQHLPSGRRIEARLAGLQPLAATDNGANLDQAVDGALDKLVALLDRKLGRLGDRKGRTSYSGEVAD